MRSTLDLLHDVRRAAVAALALKGSPASAYGRFDNRALICYAVVQISEALSHIPPEVLSLAPSIPARAIRAMRNRVVHVYWDVDTSLLQAVVEQDLEPLLHSIDRLTAGLPAPDMPA